MRVAFIVHDFSLTGAPKLGVEIANLLAERHEVVLFSKLAGPLSETLDMARFVDVVDCATSHELGRMRFSDRVSRYESLIAHYRPDLVYVNSLAAADWLAAAQNRNLPTVLHLHEMKNGVAALERIDIFRRQDVEACDLVIAASRECADDAMAIFQFRAQHPFVFGICIDVERIRAMAGAQRPVAIRHDEQILTFDEGRRPPVIMCGQACRRKGADLFYRVARAIPELDFLWIGPWDDPASRQVNPAVVLNAREPAANLYWTNSVANPYPLIASGGLFVLTSREDPNPLVIPEAIALGVASLSFSGTGGGIAWTDRFGFTLSGDVDPDRIARFVRRFFAQADFCWPAPNEFFVAVDLHSKVPDLITRVEELVPRNSG